MRIKTDYKDLANIKTQRSTLLSRAENVALIALTALLISVDWWAL